jgi:cyclopropane fatty-acyl-phospholipid synthase-like methyltransferase
MLPFSEASERNKGPILAVLRDELAGSRDVMEIGAGTGQHAVHFALELPHLTWQPTDRAEYLAGLAARVAAEGSENLYPPLELDVTHSRWPSVRADVIYSANTLHIMSWSEVEAFLSGVGRVLPDRGLLLIYGPFRYRGQFTSQSNARFDLSLKARDPQSGVRDFEAVDALATAEGLARRADHAMPSNNQLIVWQRVR